MDNFVYGFIFTQSVDIHTGYVKFLVRIQSVRSSDTPKLSFPSVVNNIFL